MIKIQRAKTGITPAHAGKTFHLQEHYLTGRDHPRACGENCEPLHAEKGGQGSPPRMRGKPAAPAVTEDFRGITPAHAGKTTPTACNFRKTRDHPRACGENNIYPQRCFPPPGSPPRMRGKHFGKGVFPWLILVLSLDPL